MKHLTHLTPHCKVVGSMPTSSVVDCEFEPRCSCQTKDCTMDICCFSANYGMLKSKNSMLATSSE